ncbi:hypothetical protein [Providencia alcalifaciens]|uniref:hypothetical protein n=1 Tax=Providencia alcalifaciens TaxID=126385 RepID=UPI001CC68978|nr:hypothetical protein [Providencia alcalifaciens]CAG9416277.1 hypothetical protein NVI2019_GHJFPKLH_01365 [Providencia alcalifaciens]
MFEIIIPVITAIAGFVAGALVYRKHTKEAERIVQQLKAEKERLQKRLDEHKK